MAKRMEDKIREDFSAHLNVPLEKGKIEMGTRPDGTPLEHEFDMISPDEKIVGIIKINRLTLRTRPNKKAYGSLYSVMSSILYLHKLSGKRDLYLVIADNDMYEEITYQLGDMVQDLNIVKWDDFKRKRKKKK
ncbi:MAG: hypothetical protein GY771_01020 [bacterium]|nr:hypothetical protein [bacterium]